jgi:hypothetical protein
MKVQMSGLIYDSENADCEYITSNTQGRWYAFVKCYDIKSGAIKTYWGVKTGSDEQAISSAMETGSRWPNIRRTPKSFLKNKITNEMRGKTL